MTRRDRDKVRTSTSVKYHALVQSLHRASGIRNPATRVLIVCEDTKSAPQYLEELKRELRLSATSVCVLHSDGYTQPKQVVERAVSEKAKAVDGEKRGGAPQFHKCYAVVDGDFGHKIKAARKLALENDIELIVSTPCFETWVLYHVAHWDAQVHKCDDVLRELKNHLPNYHKGSFSYSQLIGKYDEARARARKLRQPDVLPEEKNPCSDMYKMLDDLLKICESADEESTQVTAHRGRK